ncbi:MAG TPA: hypothetical protein VHH90_10225 [Polyangia bacterium]|nr:hypothetical protein [Polyangia bacterium]
MKRFTSLCLFGVVAAFVIVSCSERSLVVMDVKSANGSIAFADVDLLVRAGVQQQTRFDNVSFDSAKAFRAGVYLSSDVSGTITLNAEVDDPVKNCKVGMGSVTASNVSPGNIVQGLTLIIQPLQPCVPIADGGTTGDGGSGGARASGGTQGAGGSSFTGGHGGGGGPGQGGMPGSGGAATGGHGGALGTGGLNGAGGAVGTGGTLGTGGLASTGGAIGTGGVKGTGGVAGTGGVVGAGGVVGTGGIVGAGGVIGTGGVVGTGGVPGSGGVTGMGGSGACTCPNPNEICDATGGCVCKQTDAEACAASGVSCGTTVVNECNQKVVCVCPTGYLCNASTFTCVARCFGGTGGILAAGATDAVICPPPPVTTQ